MSSTGRSTGILNVVAVGDELVAGLGDARGQGWVGRVAARTLSEGHNLRMFGLGVPSEGTAALSSRWYGEASRRYATSADNRLIIGLGCADLGEGLSLARSRLNLANLLDEALSKEVSTFVVGPTPTVHDEANRRIQELSAGFADVASRRGVNYVDTFTPLLNHEQWRTDVGASDIGLPAQAGYGLLAWLVLNRGWYSWLGLPSPA
ncbi:GDSL-type esterase/lipase family protein [Saxibacter everestensis]|uniref:GDSL-type esterase/lipase family protein n=1 Tax=Saxibacter everestensis TaxID=2909229 RepID=A0ABY8QNG5_9MICO|nr:GDSL-type esterase/lipase family protein [Brevibacteriaceae bacterium ZFBP1038]